MTLRWLTVLTVVLFMGFILLAQFIGGGTSCPGLPTGHEWVADCDVALEKLERTKQDDEDG
jgi:hypothetical protein